MGVCTVVAAILLVMVMGEDRCQIEEIGMQIETTLYSLRCGKNKIIDVATQEIMQMSSNCTHLWPGFHTSRYDAHIRSFRPAPTTPDREKSGDREIFDDGHDKGRSDRKRASWHPNCPDYLIYRTYPPISWLSWMKIFRYALRTR